MNILLYNPDNGVSRNFMPHLWMFLLQALTPPEHKVLLIDGNAQAVTEDELAASVAQLPAWTVHEGKLHRRYQFHDFAHAMGFLAIAAPMIERMNHHPEWSNVYNRVTVDLSTHDSGGITHKDVELAAALEKLPSAFTEILVSLEIARTLSRVDAAKVPDMPDRIITATALHFKVPLVSRDSRIRDSGIATIW